MVTNKLNPAVIVAVRGPGQKKSRQPKNFQKVETATGRAEKCDTIFESHYRNTQIRQDKHS